MTTTQLTLSEIYIYPIKSAKGIALKKAKLSRGGLQFDRRWMIVDENGQFLSQRQKPRIALISTAIENDQLIITAPGMARVSISIRPKSDAVMTAQVWNDHVKAISLKPETQKWFNTFLGIDAHLVYMPEDVVRKVDPDFAVHHTDQVSFADGYPFHLISEASVKDFNTRLIRPVPTARFRPNLVIRGCPAFAEDEWQKISIGSVIFHVVKPCGRCKTITVNQKTAEVDKEPLQILSQFRKRDGKVLFGQNLIQETEGVLKVGNLVKIID